MEKKNLTQKQLVEFIEKRINNEKDTYFDYIVDSFGDMDYSWVHIINNADEIDWSMKGWQLWIIKNIPEEDKHLYKDPKNECMFLQLAVGPWGNDHHMLLPGEINSFLTFFTGDYYMMNAHGREFYDERMEYWNNQ